MTITATRRLTFCAGHRVHMHESKCAHPHGHNYVCFIECSGDLDSLGRVVDFSVIKEHVGGWLDKNWDHGFIYWVKDPFAAAMLISFQATSYIVPKAFCMPTNPTAENMAAFLYEIASKLLGELGVKVLSVRIDETENCSAIYKADA